MHLSTSAGTRKVPMDATLMTPHFLLKHTRVKIHP